MYMSRVLRADQQDLVKDYFCMVSRPATIETEKGKLISYSISEITKSDSLDLLQGTPSLC